MIVGRPDVSLRLDEDDDRELVLGYREDGEDGIQALATADAGVLQLFREGPDA